MKKNIIKDKRRLRRKRSIRKNVIGTSEKPRISVFKSNKYIYVQAIDDNKSETILTVSSLKYEDKKLNKKVSEKVGDELGKKLVEKKINKVVFDRNGYIYTGKIKALADATRKAGVIF